MFFYTSAKWKYFARQENLLYTEELSKGVIFEQKEWKAAIFFSLQNQVDDGSKLRSLRQKCNCYALTD